WWAARCLHFAKLNVSCWFDGSDLVAIEHWGFRRPQWCMKLKPKDWQPLPEVYRLERERERQEAMARYRVAAQEGFLRAKAGRQEAVDASAVQNPDCRAFAAGRAAMRKLPDAWNISSPTKLAYCTGPFSASSPS
ncbi:hypothetical protein, partial [Mesorhizobium sp. 128a]